MPTWDLGFGPIIRRAIAGHNGVPALAVRLAGERTGLR
jgi:hypothetical protein